MNDDSPASLDVAPLFDQPVSWHVSKAAVPDILQGLGEALPDVQEALRKGQESRFDSFTVYLMPDEAEAIWDRFAEIRESKERAANAAAIEEGTTGSI